MISAWIVVASMWKNSLKNVESDNNKILYETLLDFFCSEMVLTVWISLVDDSFSPSNHISSPTFFNGSDILEYGKRILFLQAQLADIETILVIIFP